MVMNMYSLATTLLVALATTNVAAFDATFLRSAVPQAQQAERKLQDATIAELAEMTPSLSTLVTALDRAALVGVVSNTFLSLTTFAPTNDAFNALDPELFALLLTPAYFQHLQNVLLYHVADGTSLSTDLADSQALTMLNREVLTVSIDGTTGDVSLINGAGIVRTVALLDILAVNGVVHVMNGVLLPSFAYRSVIDLAAGYSTVVSLIESAGLESVVRSGILTLFAPNNDAFGNLPAETVTFLTSEEGRDELIRILSYHLLPRVVTSEKMTNGVTALTLEGSPVTFGVADDIVTVDDAMVTEFDILAANGVTHGIDRVLTPPVPPPTSSPTGSPTTSVAPTPVPVTIADIAVATPSLSTLVTAVTTVGLVATLDSPAARLTVFAPSNDAFAALPAAVFAALLTPAFGQHLTNVLLYHVILGSVVLSTDLSDGLEVTMLNGETNTIVIDGDSYSLANGEGDATMVSAVDVLATNGVVHLLDGVLLPSFIYRTVINLSASYSTLFSLVSLAELEEKLVGGAWTLFAPTNDAFEALPEATVTFLFSPEGLETLINILTYHIVPAVLTTDKFSDGAMATTAQGGKVTIGITDGAITVNDIAVSDADILAINGVSHGIDGVLFPPPPETATPTVSPTTSSPTATLETMSPTTSPTELTIIPPETVAPTSSPTTSPTATPETMSPTTSPTEPTIVDLIVNLAVTTSSLSTLVAAVTTAGFTETLADPVAMLTVFAPSNDAFASLLPAGILDTLLTSAFSQHLTNVLRYHVLGAVVVSKDLSDGLEATMANGEILTVGIDGAMVSLTTGNGVVTMVSAVDIMASNGVVHLIDGVLLPSFVYRSVIDVGASYSILLALVELAGLKDSLTGGQFTLFAPNDDAFGKLPQATLDFLTNPDGRDSLADILKYHVVSMVLTSDKLTDGGTATTLQGGTVTIGISGDTVTVNGSSTVTEADILAINGVTHGLDTVLIPASGISAPTMAPTSDTSAGAALCTPFLGLFVMMLAMAL